MNVVEIKGLSKNYGSKTALNNVSLDIPPGKIVGLLGPNGSGKTTMIKILTGLISDYEGTVAVNGLKPGYESCSSVSYLPDKTVLPAWMKVKAAVSLYKDFYSDFDAERANDMLSEMNIDLNKKIKTLSKGMIEKLQLALVMSRRSRLYVLDEPIAAVDPAARDFILRTILTNFGDDSSILLSTHIISDIEPVLDIAVFLKEGEINMAEDAEGIRQRTGKSIDNLFREVFRC